MKMTDQNSKLMAAVEERKLAACQAALNAGADIHAESDEALRYAAKCGHLDIVKYQVEQGTDTHAENDAALYLAAAIGDTKDVKCLVEQGADIHANNDATILVAAEKGRIEIVRYLLDAALYRAAEQTI